MLSGDAKRMLRYSPESLVTWPILATDDYFVRRESGFGRDAVVHPSPAGDWSEVAVLLPGGRHFIISSMFGTDDARQFAKFVAKGSPRIDPVAISAGTCYGELSSLDLAVFSGEVFRQDDSLTSENACLLVSESGALQVSLHASRVSGDQNLVTNTYWSEALSGLGRSAVGHRPESDTDLYGVAILAGTRQYEIFGSSKDVAFKFALKVLPLLPQA